MKTEVIEKPMLFSAPMVRAILEGRKVMTRRVCKRAHADDRAESACAVCKCSDGSFIAWYGPKQDCDQAAFQAFTEKQYPNGGGFFPPHPVGSRIWVKERWGYDNKEYVETYKAETWRGMPSASTAEVHYLATEPEPDIFPKGYWKSSLFMPRWASRITLEVTDVRVERLQEITPQDAVAEGACFWWDSLGREEQERMYCGGRGEIGAMRALWCMVNGPGSWERNDWVWVYTFKRLSQEATHGI